MPIRHNNSEPVLIQENDFEQDIDPLNKKYDYDFKKKETIWTKNEIKKLNYGF